MDFSVPPATTPDDIDPTAEFLNPTDDEIVSSNDNFTISGTASDENSGINFVRARVERQITSDREYWNGTDWVASAAGTFLEASFNNGNWELTGVDLSQTADYNLRLIVRDNAGNQPPTSEFSVDFSVPPAATPDDIDPTAAIQNPTDDEIVSACLLYTSPSPRDQRGSRMPSSA